MRLRPGYITNPDIEYRMTRHEFIAGALVSAAKAKKEGSYVPADRVVGKLARMLAKAKQHAGAGRKSGWSGA